jgi:hypothetical protein
MAKRLCVVCNKEKDMEGGKICEEGHFVCEADINSWIPGNRRTVCPLDKTKLR